MRMDARVCAERLQKCRLLSCMWSIRAYICIWRIFGMRARLSDSGSGRCTRNAKKRRQQTGPWERTGLVRCTAAAGTKCNAMYMLKNDYPQSSHIPCNARRRRKLLLCLRLFCRAVRLKSLGERPPSEPPSVGERVGEVLGGEEAEVDVWLVSVGDEN